MSFATRTPAVARLGQTLAGRYELEAVLESDVLAHTYLAMDAGASAAAPRVVVSVLHSELGGAPGIGANFARGPYVASMIGSGAPAVRDTGLTRDGLPFVAFEHVARETLRAFLARRRGCIPAMEALRIAAAALEVLSAAHDRALFHGDLSPRRILLGDLGEVYISGFGWGKLRERAATQFGLVCPPGAAAYFSPEQARTHAASESGDLWALGAILFELLSSRRMREGQSDEKLLLAAASRPAPSLALIDANAPRELVGLLERALDLNAARRFDSAAAFARACTLVANLPNPWFWRVAASRRVAATEPSFPVPISSVAPRTGEPAPHTSIVAPRPGRAIPRDRARAAGASDVPYPTSPTLTGIPVRIPPRGRS